VRDKERLGLPYRRLRHLQRDLVSGASDVRFPRHRSLRQLAEHLEKAKQTEPFDPSIYDDEEEAEMERQLEIQCLMQQETNQTPAALEERTPSQMSMSAAATVCRAARTCAEERRPLLHGKRRPRSLPHRRCEEIKISIASELRIGGRHPVRIAMSGSTRRFPCNDNPKVRHEILGSIAEGVMRAAPCPVLIVKPRCKLRSEEHAKAAAK